MILKMRTYLALMIVTIIVLSGCSNDKSSEQYQSSAKKFNQIYFDVIENVDITNTSMSLEQLQSEDNRKRIEELGKLVEDIENTIPENKEQLLINFKDRYDDLKFLVDSYSQLDNLSHEDRRKIYKIFISIGMNKDNWEDKKSLIIWE